MQNEPSPILVPPSPLPPSAKRQSWSVVISIIIIVIMVVLGAFYSWGKRIDEQNLYAPGATE